MIVPQVLHRRPGPFLQLRHVNCSVDHLRLVGELDPDPQAQQPPQAYSGHRRPFGGVSKSVARPKSSGIVIRISRSSRETEGAVEKICSSGLERRSIIAVA